MTTAQIYKKTFKFTLMKALTGFIGIVLIIGLTVLGFLLSAKLGDGARVGICIGAFTVACVLAGLLSHFAGHLFRAGQIAMAAEGIVKGELPEDTFEEGKKRVRERFGTVAVFYAIERVINAIVHQITNGVTKVTNAISTHSKNDAANYVGAAVNIFVSAVMAFLCSCCMGWVFVHPEDNPWRAACDGAIVYFKNWKDLLKNAGKVIAMALVSLIVLGGILFGLTCLVTAHMDALPSMAAELTAFCAEEMPDITLTAAEWFLVFKGVIAFILWIVVHSAFIDPFIMISVMNRYLTAGIANPPARTADRKLMELSRGYKKAIGKAAN